MGECDAGGRAVPIVAFERLLGHISVVRESLTVIAWGLRLKRNACFSTANQLAVATGTVASTVAKARIAIPYLSTPARIASCATTQP